MPTIDDIPGEILEEIFKKNHSFKYGRDENPTPLPSAALVCRRWRGPAQRVLFRHLDFSSASRTSRWLASPARPRHRIKSVCICWEDQDEQQEQEEGRWDTMLAACEGIASRTALGSVYYDLLLLPSLGCKPTTKPH